MNLLPQKRIVLLGMMARYPVGGVVWLTAQYLVGFQRLGYDVYYVEAHGATPKAFMEGEDDGSERAAAFIAGVMDRFDLDGRWAFHALHSDHRCYGLSERALKDVYASADAIINLHGGTPPLPDHSSNGTLVYLETDPVEREIEVYHEVQDTIDLLRAHDAFFTWGLNYGNPDCRVPLPQGIHFKPSCPPVVLDFWQRPGTGGGAFTTIGNWRQLDHEVTYRGEVYRWSKHYEFLKFLDLPRLTAQRFELSLVSCDEDDRRMLEDNGWHVRDAFEFSTDVDGYQAYICGSRGEFTVAKDQNVRLRSGWFSERSAQYLAAGRPVITQETGFSNYLPTGQGLFGFSTMEEILAAVDAINSNYEQHCNAAAELARQYFNYDVVLGSMLRDIGL